MSVLEIPHTPETQTTSFGTCSLEDILDDPNAIDLAGELMPGMGELEIPRTEKRILQTVGEIGLKRSAARYGNGGPDFGHGPSNVFTTYGPHHRTILGYNTVTHNDDVGNYGEQLSQAYNLGSLVCEASKTAGRLHDSRQDAVIATPQERNGKDELRSAQECVDLLAERMAQAKKDIDREKIRKVALWTAYFMTGTMATFGGDGAIKQYGAIVEQDELPCPEALQACQFGACSDLGGLYDTYANAFYLIPQRASIVHPNVPDLSDDATRSKVQGFVEQQIPFLTDYRYCLPKAEILFAPNRERVVNHMINLLKICETGDLTTNWGEFIRHQQGWASFFRRTKPAQSA